jgi:hypothetical protein
MEEAEVHLLSEKADPSDVSRGIYLSIVNKLVHFKTYGCFEEKNAF